MRPFEEDEWTTGEVSRNVCSKTLSKLVYAFNALKFKRTQYTVHEWIVKADDD
jgi:hypothetical protein